MSQNRNKKGHGKRHNQKSSWPLVVAGGGLLLILAAVFAFSQPAKPKAAIEVAGTPSLKVDKEKVDLGDVKLGKVVDVAFTLENVGDQPLKLGEAPYVEVVEGC